MRPVDTFSAWFRKLLHADGACVQTSISISDAVVLPQLCRQVDLLSLNFSRMVLVHSVEIELTE